MSCDSGMRFTSSMTSTINWDNNIYPNQRGTESDGYWPLDHKLYGSYSAIRHKLRRASSGRGRPLRTTSPTASGTISLCSDRGGCELLALSRSAGTQLSIVSSDGVLQPLRRSMSEKRDLDLNPDQAT